MSIREEFVIRALEMGANISALCDEQGISRKTGYKWIERYKQRGVRGLDDLSRRPDRQPMKVSGEVVALIVSVRVAHPKWGAKKIAVSVAHQLGGKGPSPATVARVLVRTGLLQPGRRIRRSSKPAAKRPAPRVAAPNDLWTVDFKGWWRTQDGKRCEPLTIRDAHSRYVIAVDVLATNRYDVVRRVFERVFRAYGLPKAIQSDNGIPFAATSGSSPHRLSRLSAWWLSMGIEHFLSRPAKPQDNGAHERMHRDLAEEVEAHRAATHRSQQNACDRWRHEFNQHRPHEALGMKMPAALYHRSKVEFSAAPAEPQYPDDFIVRTVGKRGCIVHKRAQVFISETISHRHVGLEWNRKDRTCVVWFAQKRLGVICFDDKRPVLKHAA